jgi:hypothetical protein
MRWGDHPSACATIRVACWWATLRTRVLTVTRVGDGVLIYFGYPQAHEDDAERAVRAGLELVAAVGALKTHAALQTRVGIATANSACLSTRPIRSPKPTPPSRTCAPTRISARSSSRFERARISETSCGGTAIAPSLTWHHVRLEDSRFRRVVT